MSAGEAEAIKNSPGSPNYLYLEEFTEIEEGGLNPLTPPNQGLRRTREGNAVNIQLVRSDHPVHMDKAVIRALGRKLLRRELVAIDQARTVSLPQRNVASSILVKERI